MLLVVVLGKSDDDIRCFIEVGGMHATELDFEIPERGVDIDLAA